MVLDGLHNAHTEPILMIGEPEMVSSNNKSLQLAFSPERKHRLAPG